MDATPLPSSQPAGGVAEPWRRRMLRTLLYGRNVDRNVKARARVGLAILAFGAVYLAIAARLIMFAVVSDSHLSRAAASRRTPSPPRAPTSSTATA